MNNPVLTVAYVATGKIIGRRIVAHDTTEEGRVQQATGALNVLAGVSTLIDAEEGQHVDVHRMGFAPVTYGALLSRGQPVTADAQGRAIVATAGQFYIGFAEEDGDEEEIGSIFIAPGYVPN